MSLVLENASFSQELTDTFQQPTDDLSFEVKRRLRRVARKSPKGKTVYGKSGKRLIGKYVRK